MGISNPYNQIRKDATIVNQSKDLLIRQSPSFSDKSVKFAPAKPSGRVKESTMTIVRSVQTSPVKEKTALSAADAALQ